MVWGERNRGGFGNWSGEFLSGGGCRLGEGSEAQVLRGNFAKFSYEEPKEALQGKELSLRGLKKKTIYAVTGSTPRAKGRVGKYIYRQITSTWRRGARSGPKNGTKLHPAVPWW